MSTETITPTAEYDASSLAVTTESAGGLALRRGPGPLGTFLQKLADRAAFARDAASQKIDWTGEISVDPGGTNSTFAVNVGAIGSVVLYDGSKYVALFAAATTIGASKISGGGNLANSTWYYVYAFNNAGSVDYEISTTAPLASRRTKTGDTTRRYLGCFPTLSTGAPVPLRASRGRYVYRHSGSAVADTRVLSSGNQTTNTAVDCSALVPPHARLATVRAELVSTATAINYAYVRTDGDSGADEIAIPLPNINAVTTSMIFDIELSNSRNIAYRVTNTTGAPGLTLFVGGFYE